MHKYLFKYGYAYKCTITVFSINFKGVNESWSFHSKLGDNSASESFIKYDEITLLIGLLKTFLIIIKRQILFTHYAYTKILLCI